MACAPFVRVLSVEIVAAMRSNLVNPDADTTVESMLLAAITRAQSQFVQSHDTPAVFEGMLDALLHLTLSEYGFIGEVLHDTDGSPYLKTQAISNIAWNEETQQLYEENVDQGLEFRNLKTLFGHVIKTGEPVISNEPGNDSRASGIPKGHPPLDAFLGLPFHHRDTLIGMVGIANRPGGYDSEMVETLGPFLATCTNIILSSRARKEQAAVELSLRESEARGRAILDNAIDGIITIDHTGRIESCNRAVARIFGYDSDELLGRNVKQLMPAEHAANHDHYIKSYVETGRARIIGSSRELTAKRRDGSEFPVELAINELRLEGRQLFVGMLRDITERKASEERTSQLTAELKTRVSELDRLNEQNAMLSELGSYLQASQTKEEAYDVLLAYVRALFAEQSGALYRLSETHGAHCVIAWGNEAHLLSQSLQKHECWAMRRGEMHEVGISDASIRCHHYNGTGEGHQLCVPVMTQNGPIGLLTLHAPITDTAVGIADAPRNRSVLRGIADRLGPALSSIELRMRLQEDSIRDPLTKLYNRRFLAESLQRELRRASRAEQQLSLIMLDLDKFKGVNDEFGHDVGDQVLVLLAQQLHQSFREEDLIYRYGGDEFLVIMPGASLNTARQRVLDACRGTRALHIDTDKGPLHVTLSAGVATAPEHGMTEEALIARADEALYTAKQSGRDRVRLAVGNA